MLPPPPGKGNRVKDRLWLLGRQVPVCRKLSAPSLLDETMDYVVALKMLHETAHLDYLKALSTLTNIYSQSPLIFSRR
ncbi:transcription factor bHLH147-like [Canna indica]|uniref:Transcription factor bHLH147-like n=1 Tax=Canna indica TaxID=4628 RepID=A0AAQ3KFH3_9LILI|nr:transcription factor bHLH147-like [Canna indica]